MISYDDGCNICGQYKSPLKACCYCRVHTCIWSVCAFNTWRIIVIHQMLSLEHQIIVAFSHQLMLVIEHMLQRVCQVQS